MDRGRDLRAQCSEKRIKKPEKWRVHQRQQQILYFPLLMLGFALPQERHVRMDEQRRECRKTKKRDGSRKLCQEDPASVGNSRQQNGKQIAGMPQANGDYQKQKYLFARPLPFPDHNQRCNKRMQRSSKQIAEYRDEMKKHS